MRYLLDTNICIYLRKDQSPKLKQKFYLAGINNLYISSITVAELEFGVAKSSQSEKNAEVLEKFLSELKAIDFDIAAAREYGRIRALLEKNGTPIGSNDILIASTAISRDFILVTNNEREFSRVDRLKIENWTN
jgi:tRNA(fMet)-specific endonuclease VapC